MGALKKPELSGSLCNVAADLIDNWCDEFCEPAFRLAWLMHDFAAVRGKPADRPNLVGEFYRIWRCYRTRFDEGDASKLAIAALRASAKVEGKTSRMANVIDHAMQLARNLWPTSEISQSWRSDYLSNKDEQQLASRVTDDDFDDPVEYVRPGETASDITASLCDEARLARAVLDKWRIDGYSPPEQGHRPRGRPSEIDRDLDLLRDFEGRGFQWGKRGHVTRFVMELNASKRRGEQFGVDTVRKALKRAVSAKSQIANVE